MSEPHARRGSGSRLQLGPGDGDAKRRGLFTLLDLIRFYLDRMVQQIANLPIYSYSLKAEPNYPGEVPPRQMTDVMLAIIEQDCGELGLDVTKAQVETMRVRIGEGWPEPTKDEWDHLAGEFVARLVAESSKKLFFQIPPDRQSYYVEELDPRGGYLDVAYAFPSAQRELAHASRCYALNETTASVFHSMRAAESAVRVLARRLREVAGSIEGGQTETPATVTAEKDLDYMAFGPVVGEIRAKVEKLRQMPSGAEKAEQLRFYQTAALQLERSKDAWRDDVAHCRRSYGADEALKALQATRDLLAHLAANGCNERTEQE